MKHIFSVHSPITFLVSHAIIEHRKLAVEDVIILSNSYELPINIYESYPFYSNLTQSTWQKLTQLNSPLAEDRYINSILGKEDFIVYIDMMSYHQRVFVTHDRCRGFHFIEEGSTSYRDFDTLDDLTWDKRNQSFRLRGIGATIIEMIKAAKWAARGYSQRLLSIPYSLIGYNHFEGVKYFGLSDLTHPTISESRKVIVPLKKSSELQQMAGGVQLADCLIWVDGSGKAFTKLPDDVYHRAIDKGIEKLRHELKSRPIYLKLRPGIEDYNSNYLYNTLVRQGFEVSVLPNKLILECVFANSENCVVVGNLSSALFYANIFGHDSYSIYSLFESKVPSVYDRLPGFWSKVNQL